MASLEDRVTSAAGVPASETKVDWAEDNSQLDGATEFNAGSAMTEPEYDVEVKLIDQNSPLYSIKSFEELGLSEAIIKGIYTMRFQRPSKIQEKALPLLLSNPSQNMIGQSQSGTGKTAAFVLNILSRLDLSTPQSQKSPQAMVLAPTRELARQIIGVIQVMGSFIEGLRVCAAIPAEASKRNQKIEGAVVVGTPGTTMDLIKKRLLDPSNIKVLVLDEADNMLDQQGMGEQCMRVKMFVHSKSFPSAVLIPHERMLRKDTIQIVLFSATFPDKVVDYAQKFAPQANQITLRHDELTVEGIKQLYMDCASEQDKYEVLVKLYGLMTIGSSIIFVKRRDTAAEIERRMTAEGHKVASLTGAFEGHERDMIIDAFRTGLAKVLITTNVLARGIDVQSVSMVVNYDVPDDGRGQPDPQTYLHRIGRTGRFGRVGVSISFVYDQKSWKQLMDISKYFNITMLKVETKDWDLVEETIKKVIKSPAANPDYKPQQTTEPQHVTDVSM
ncbi:RNA helicase required for poly(A+) mRNA export [Xylographa vitiligo]|nr:RNA helicase required for poly(A+) mRNA export [Xylographa vitiligo]